MAQKAADQARKDRKPVVMEPMLPSERRIVHLALKTNPDVETYSEGQDPLRKVVVVPKKKSYKPAGASSLPPKEASLPLPVEEEEIAEEILEPETSVPEPAMEMEEIEEVEELDEEPEYEKELPPPSNFDLR